MDKQPIQGLTWPVRKIETDVLDDDTTVELPYWTTITSDEIFKDKKVLVISLPFAYDSAAQVPLQDWNDNIEKLRENKVIDDIVVVGCEHYRVMSAYMAQFPNLKFIADRNLQFTEKMDMVVDLKEQHIGKTTWRYNAVVDNCIIEKIFIEPGIQDDADVIPFTSTDVGMVLGYLLGVETKLIE